MHAINNISFYKVNLVCNVVSSIGCGSRSKPILIALENNECVYEVKLNRKGNTLAVVWNNKKNIANSKVISSVFSNYELTANEINADSSDELLYSFVNDKKKWLGALQIDELSKEEAQVVAKQLLNIYTLENELSTSHKLKLKKDIESVFYEFFLNFECMQQLSDTDMYRKLIFEVIDKSKAYIDANNIPSTNLLLHAIGGHWENKDRLNCCD